MARALKGSIDAARPAPESPPAEVGGDTGILLFNRCKRRFRLGGEMAGLLLYHMTQTGECLACGVTWDEVGQRWPHHPACTLTAWQSLGLAEDDEEGLWAALAGDGREGES